MLIACTDGNGGQADHIKMRVKLHQHGGLQTFSNSEVGRQRKVGAVLFNGAEYQHCYRIALGELG